MSDVFAFTSAFEPDSLAKIKQFANWKPILEEELLKAHEKADALIQVIEKGNMPYLTGALADSPDVMIDNPYQSSVFTDSPYAWRREEGFSGMTDSLGRFYPNDPGMHYAARTVQQVKFQVGDIFGYALDATLARLGVI